MLVCFNCGSSGQNNWDLVGQAFSDNGVLLQQSYQCQNPKCGKTTTINPDNGNVLFTD